MVTISSSPSVTAWQLHSLSNTGLSAVPICNSSTVLVWSHISFFFFVFNSEALPGEMPPEQVGDYTSLYYNPRCQF